jgi:hypothetical protein
MFANQCGKFVAGESVRIDVEVDEPLENYSDDDEIKELLRRQAQG